MERLNAFTLEPMSAGDIIDRAVRIYKKQFAALIRLVLPPGLMAYGGIVAMTFGLQNISLGRGDARLALSILLLIGGFLIWATGKIAFYVVLGGTSRALVNYFLDGTPLRPREVYRAIRERFWPLLGATLMTGVMLVITVSLLYLLIATTLSFYILGAALALSKLPFVLQVICHIVFGALLIIGLLCLGLLIFKRLIFIPPALMVEGHGVFSAIGRSFSLADNNIRQIGAIVFFNMCVTWSVVMLLMVPLVWVGYLNGVSLSPFDSQKPFWYAVSQQTVSQLSEILLMPILMLGFTMMYLDARVRKEGFDVELQASRALPALPLPVQAYAPVMSPQPEPARPAVPSILGLSDYRPTGPLWPAQPVTEPAIIAPHLPDPEIPPGETVAASQTETAVDARSNLHAGEAVVRVCTNCGTSTFDPESTDRFCHICGTLFDSPQSVSSQTALPSPEAESGEVFPVAHD